MSPLVALWFLAAMWYAAKEAGTAVGSKVKESRGAAQTTGSKSGNRARANAATAGWAVREIRHGAPTVRSGWRQGWRDHRQRMAEHDSQERKDLADHAESDAGRREQDADSQRRREAADKRGQPADSQPAAPQPPAPQPAAPSPPAASPPPGSTPATNGAGPVGDVNYEQAVAYADKVIAGAEQGVNGASLSQAEQMADQLGSALGDDSETIGLASEVASDIRNIRTAYGQLLDHAQAMKDSLQRKHGPTHEAVASTGVLADRSFHDH